MCIAFCFNAYSIIKHFPFSSILVRGFSGWVGSSVSNYVSLTRRPLPERMGMGMLGTHILSWKGIFRKAKLSLDNVS
jgi:hypothetical protein